LEARRRARINTRRSEEHGADILASLWREHAYLAEELRERRTRASGMFAVAALSLVTLLGAALTTSVADLVAILPWFPTFYLGVLAFAGLVAALSLVAMNPGLPWESRSFERIGALLGGVVRLPRPDSAIADRADGKPNYRGFLMEALRREPLATTINSASDVSPEDLAIQIRALSYQLHQLRVWRRPLTALLGLDLALTFGATVIVVANRLGMPAPETWVALAVAGGIGLVIVTAGALRIELTNGSRAGWLAGRKKRTADPFRGMFIGWALGGGAGAAVTFVFSYSLHQAATPESGGALQVALLLTGLLFVPASIFAPVVGSMFPSYWKATPVGVIELGPLRELLAALVATLTYGGVATVLSLVPGFGGATWLVVFPALIGVASGTYRAAQLVDFSLRVFDPEWLADWLRAQARRGPDPNSQAFADLCRLLRGMIERERVSVALHIIVLMTEMALAREPGVELHRDLALRVLRETRQKWRRTAIKQATWACATAITDRSIPAAIGASTGATRDADAGGNTGEEARE
jgi:hypothetical protein